MSKVSNLYQKQDSAPSANVEYYSPKKSGVKRGVNFNQSDKMSYTSESFSDSLHKKSLDVDYVTSLRRAFDAADKDQDGKLSQNDWDNSELQSLIRDGTLNKYDFSQYFRKIDANYLDFITWEELTFFLMKEMNTTHFGADKEGANFIGKANIPAPPRSSCHREMVHRIAICPRSQEYITLSPDSIRFWSPIDLSLKRVITEPGNFSDFIVFNKGIIFGVTTIDRRLIFFGVDNLNKLPVEICASPSPSSIKNMNQKESITLLHTLQSHIIPLYNIPTAVCEATLPNVKLNTFFVGDDQGIIEAFHLCVPQNRQGTEYGIERFGQKTIHNGSITQISTLQTLACYASSSLDGTLHFWTFNPGSNTFNIIRTFRDKSCISSFVYSEKQSIIVTLGISREATIWSLIPPVPISKLSGHNNMVTFITEFATTDECYLLTMTNKKEFRLWDSVNWRLIKEWCDHVLQRPENRYSAGIFDPKRHTLITAASYPVKWCEDTAAYADAIEVVSIPHPIISCHYSKVFHQLIIVDEVSNFSVYCTYNSIKENQHKELWTQDMPKLVSAALDPRGRRLVTASSGQSPSVYLWNFNSGGKIADLDFNRNKGVISEIKYVNISGREYLIRAGWNHQLMIYFEIAIGIFNLYRVFFGHKADVTAIAGFQSGFVSGDADGYLMTWDVDTSSPQSSQRLLNSIECISACENYLIVGDSFGRIYLLLLPKLELIFSSNGHRLKVKTPMASIVSIPSRDIHEYPTDTHRLCSNNNNSTNFNNQNNSSNPNNQNNSNIQNNPNNQNNSNNQNNINNSNSSNQTRAITFKNSHDMISINNDNSIDNINVINNEGKLKNLTVPFGQNPKASIAAIPNISNQPSLRYINFSLPPTSLSNARYSSLGSTASLGSGSLLAPSSLSSSHKINSKNSYGITDGGNYIVWTLDNYGYIMRWELMEGKLLPTHMIRAHSIGARGLELIEDGAFLVSWGSDRCARVWSSKDLRYVGFFCDGAKWNLSDSSTWKIESPFEINPDHFLDEDVSINEKKSTDPIFLQISTSLLSISAAFEPLANNITQNLEKNQNTMINSDVKNLSISENDEIEPVEKELDFNEVRKALDELLSDSYGTRIKNQRNVREESEKLMETRSNQSQTMEFGKHLEPFSRLTDLSTKIGGLLKRRPQTTVVNVREEKPKPESRIIRPDIKPVPLKYLTVKNTKSLTLY